MELNSGCAHSLEAIVERHAKEDYEALIDLLDPDEEIEPMMRQQAMHVLGRWGNPEVVSVIALLMPDFNELELINAVNALSQVGTEEAGNIVLQYSRHQSPDVRRFALSGLNRIGGERAKQRLLEAAEDDETDFVRAKANALLNLNSEK